MNLLLHPDPTPAEDGTILRVTPATAGWEYVGFEVLSLGAGTVAARDTGDRELCVVVIAGTVDIDSDHAGWRGIGGREDPWSGPPDAAYLPPRTHLSVRASGSCESEVALCWGPARHGALARVLPGAEIDPETRGHGALERTIYPILMGDQEAESLLVVEVRNPAGHWSSYPPHKHDRLDPPAETALEETYYYRVLPDRGFGLQRVYTDDRALDESLTFADRDCVLVPRGYHTVSAPPGYDVYYLNVMAGPVRQWAIHTDPDHAWTLVP
jgi:5-deoxy-glucuronate isomerase